MAITRERTFVVVGGGVAGAEAARTLRTEGFDGRVVLVAEERHAPYERPPLSKEFLRGESSVDKLLVQEPAAWDRDRVELLTGRRVTSLDASERRLTLDDGRAIAYDGIVLATGASARRSTLSGASAPFVHTVRTIEDADRLRAAARDATSAVVVGGGWIAAETAASLRQLGLEVTLVVPAEEVLQGTLGQVVGARYTALHRRQGVRVITRARATEVVDGAARGVRLETGDIVPADIVVLGLGATPNVDLAQGAGLLVDGAIVVDDRLRTSAEGVYAAGDVAAAWHPRYRTRVRSEHWDNARRQGRTSARNLLGRDESYERIPFFYSDQFDLGMEFVGRTADADELVVRDEGTANAFIAVWLRSGRVVAGLHANTWDAKKVIDGLVAGQVALDVRRFLDPASPFGDDTPAVATAA
jgi:3-phenylpropionate/trans-cinnamate dioxygenase ferredoxin reductase component